MHIYEDISDIVDAATRRLDLLIELWCRGMIKMDDHHDEEIVVRVAKELHQTYERQFK